MLGQHFYSISLKKLFMKEGIQNRFQILKVIIWDILLLIGRVSSTLSNWKINRKPNFVEHNNNCIEQNISFFEILLMSIGIGK